VQWDPALEPFYPSHYDLENELGVAPPASLLQSYLRKEAEYDPCSQYPSDAIPAESKDIVSTAKQPVSPGTVETVPMRGANRPVFHNSLIISQPTRLYMPKPLSPARYPCFEYTDPRLATHSD
jgi:hypothetical protein